MQTGATGMLQAVLGSTRADLFHVVDSTVVVTAVEEAIRFATPPARNTSNPPRNVIPRDAFCEVACAAVSQSCPLPRRNQGILRCSQAGWGHLQAAAADLIRATGTYTRKPQPFVVYMPALDRSLLCIYMPALDRYESACVWMSRSLLRH